MERLTHEADFGLEDWEETLFFVKSDPNGAYNIIDIAKYQGEPEFDEILKNAALRLAAIEDILGDEYDLDELREMVQADREGRCVVLPCKFGGPVWRLYDDCDFPGDCYTKQKCRGCEYRNLSIEKRVFCLSMLSQNGKLDPPYYTTFADAEAALRREQDG